MMEARTRNWANSADELYVCKGGTIDKADQILGKTINSHIVPKYFFTALLHKKGDTYKALAFWVEHLNENHESDPLGNYVVSIDELETERISETVIDEIAFMCTQKVSPYVRNDRFDVLESMELNYFNRVFLRGGSQKWYLNKGIKSLLDDPNLLAHYKKQAAERGKMFSKEKTVQAVEEMLLNL